jgi:glycosyltransferase involved in cell wall biosynthesis
MVPKISIVIPSFNQGAFLEETLLSILDQNYKHLELIVIDGGSTDSSVAILEKYSEQLHYWVSEADHGQAHAINKGLKRATGDLTSFLNSDDLLLPHTLTAVAKHYQKDKKQIITGNWLEGQTLVQATERKVSHPLSIENFVLKLGLFPQPGTFWTASYPLPLLDESYHFCLDLDFFYRLMRSGYTIEALNCPVSLFRWHQESKTSNLTLVKYEEHLQFLKEVIHHHPSIVKKVRQLIARNKRTLYRLQLSASIRKNPFHFLCTCWQAFCYDPRVFIKGI